MRVGPYAIGSFDVVVDRIARADADGFPIVWTHQASGLDPFVARMAAAARQAPRIEIGTALIPAVLRHPQALAAEALTAQAAIAGRLTLGIGMSHRHVVEGRLGMSYERPAQFMGEYLEALLPLLRGETADTRGERLTMVGGLDIDGVAPPVLLGALGPRMLALAGRLADGIVTAAAGPRVLAEHIVPTLTKASGDAGRPAPKIVAAVVACITDDPESARTRIAATSKPYATFPVFQAMLEREGVTSQVDIGVIGDEATARAQAQRFIDAGATELAIRESTGTPEEAERTRAFLVSLLG